MLNQQHITYQTPWMIVRWLSPTQRVIYGRFQTRSDANSHLLVLRRLMPRACLEVVFDLE
ncbi:hypothetical protein [Fischerella sp. PCC 9605]|uniref:hypothetical protein n=1 Tax=Fischerella sp. PCC 9605 TaxID=1173024 RepID=UPI001E478C9C|nr:hypothetical protein [Fischerella sp. PCC 9605]